MVSIIGDKEFKAWVYDELLPELEAEEKGQVIQPDISIEVIGQGVADFFCTTPIHLLR